MKTPTPKFDSFSTTSGESRQGLDRMFWLLCVVVSTSSVAILTVLLASILFRGLPAFFSHSAAVDRQLAELRAEQVQLQTQATQASTNASELSGKLTELEDKIAATEQVRARIVKSFFTKPPAADAHEAGIGPALMGSIWVCAVCAMFFLPLGIGTAIYLEEFRPRNKFLLWCSDLLQLNISNLAGVPSIVYGILGLTAFANMFGLFGAANEPKFEIGTQYSRQYLTEGMEVVFLPVSGRDEVPKLKTGLIARDGQGRQVELNVIGPEDDFPDDDEVLKRSLLSDADGGIVSHPSWYSFRLPFGRSVLAASLTLMLVILPVIIISSQEALRSVPSSLRDGAMGLGCTRWQVVRHVTLPSALPGIMTGAILSMSRAIGEAAPILMIAGVVYITTGPHHLMDEFAVLPLQIYYWAGQPFKVTDDLNFQQIAAGGIIVLLVVLFAFNSVAVFLRQHAQKKLS